MRNTRDHIIRAGRPAKLTKMLQQCNADAERMRREAEKRAATDKPAPVSLKVNAGGEPTKEAAQHDH